MSELHRGYLHGGEGEGERDKAGEREGEREGGLSQQQLNK